jgi:hypothetical protein
MITQRNVVNCTKEVEESIPDQSESHMQESFKNQFDQEGPTLTGLERDKLESLLWEYKHVSSTGTGDIGRIDAVYHSIPTGDASATSQESYPYDTTSNRPAGAGYEKERSCTAFIYRLIGRHL